MAANLTIAVKPQITKDGLITLDVIVNYEQFIAPAGQQSVTSGNRSQQAVTTSVIMGNNEVLALGGLIQDSVDGYCYKSSYFGRYPILGNLFKNTIKQTTRTSLLVLIMPEIIPTNNDAIADKITEDKIWDTKSVYYTESKHRDPLLRWFFKDKTRHGEAIIDDFMDLKDKYIDESQYARIEKPEHLKKGPRTFLITHVEEIQETPVTGLQEFSEPIRKNIK